MQNGVLFNTTNFLVPAAGTTHGYTTAGLATSTPTLGNFQSVQFSGLLFSPQGAYFDNTQGTAPLVVTLMPINYTITIPTGTSQQLQFPAPSGLSYSITGAGNYTIIWVDYPVFPAGSVVSVAGGTLNVDVLNTVSSTIPATPNNGSAYVTQALDDTVAVYTNTATTATSFNVSTGGVNSYNLYKLQLYLSSDATQTTAGVIKVTLNVTNSSGPLIFSRSIYVPSTATNDDRGYTICDIDFPPGVTIPLGVNPIVCTTSTALTAGTYSLTAWVR